MRLRVVVLGRELLELSTEPAEPSGAPDFVATPVGFTGVTPDQGVPYVAVRR